MNMQLQALDDFRSTAREWLEENCPPSMRTPMVQEEIAWGGRNAHYENPESKIWLERMAKNLRPVTPRLKLTTKSPARAVTIIAKRLFVLKSAGVRVIQSLDLALTLQV